MGRGRMDSALCSLAAHTTKMPGCSTGHWVTLMGIVRRVGFVQAAPFGVYYAQVTLLPLSLLNSLIGLNGNSSASAH
jgi:hypothetical protein